jgi:hypothetical protein
LRHHDQQVARISLVCCVLAETWQANIVVMAGLVPAIDVFVR